MVVTRGMRCGEAFAFYRRGVGKEVLVNSQNAMYRLLDAFLHFDVGLKYIKHGLKGKNNVYMHHRLFRKSGNCNRFLTEISRSSLDIAGGFEGTAEPNESTVENG